MPSLSAPHSRNYNAAIAHLCSIEPLFERLCTPKAPAPYDPRGTGFPALARAIVGQQISVKAADSVWLRLCGAGELSPSGLLALCPTSADDLRRHGLSGQKARYLHALAQKCHQDPDFFSRLESLPDEAVLKTLTALPGIGPWTAEMYLLFSLLRPDVLPAGDWGVLQAFGRWIAPAQSADASEAWNALRPAARSRWVADHGQRWAPHRSTATWLLWQTLISPNLSSP